MVVSPFGFRLRGSPEIFVARLMHADTGIAAQWVRHEVASKFAAFVNRS
jgi:hypothetical protein